MNKDHKSKTVSSILEEVYKTKYNFSVKGEIRYIGSDTASSAKTVAKEMDAEQVRMILDVHTLFFAF